MVIEGLTVNTETGEVLGAAVESEENPQDLYDSYTRMRQEENEILGHPNVSYTKQTNRNDTHDEPEMW